MSPPSLLYYFKNELSFSKEERQNVTTTTIPPFSLLLT